MDSNKEQDIRNEYNEKRKNLMLLKEAIVSALQDNLETVQFVDSIGGRVKKKESFVKKVLKKPEKYKNPFLDIEDVIGVRVLVLFPSVSEQVSSRISTSIFPQVEVAYRQEESPKAFGYEGYQSIHSIPTDLYSFDPKGYPRVFELQVRTLFQHAFAEPEHELNYKRTFILSTSDDFAYQKKFSWIAASSWGADRILEDQLKVYLNEQK